MKVYLIRHGETFSNADGTVQAWSDSKLSENGEKQAAELSKLMFGRHFDRIIASDLTERNKRSKSFSETLAPSSTNACARSTTTAFSAKNAPIS